MTEKQTDKQTDETCQNCGHDEIFHKIDNQYGCGVELKPNSLKFCSCKKFVPVVAGTTKNQGKKPEGCGKEFDQDYGTPVYCGMIITGVLHLCPECSKKPEAGITIMSVEEVTPENLKKAFKEPKNHSPQVDKDTPSDREVQPISWKRCSEGTFNLSEMIQGDSLSGITTNEKFILIEDVKEFIKLLKERFNDRLLFAWECEQIDKLAGDDLI